MNLSRQGKWDEAIEHYEQALRHRPDFPEAHRSLAYALLCRGDFERGWPEHEWRLNCDPHPGYRINRTFWNGDNFQGRTILLHAEGGLGDTLQFIRFAPMVKRRGGRVVVRCQTPLLGLVARSPGVDLAFDGSSYEPDCHVHAPLLSLPAILGTTMATLPACVPYLATDPVLVEHWRSELARALGVDSEALRASTSEPGLSRPTRPFLIGIAWQGNPARRMDHWRSFPLAQFAPLAELPGVRLISLQTDHGLDQLDALNGRFPIIVLTGRRGRDFMETAAIMTHLDLVITPDTAVAHLAGALAMRVWAGIGSIGDWRYPHGRDDTPWYPTMRLFRQTTLGDWDGVFRRMTRRLDARARAARRSRVSGVGNHAQARFTVAKVRLGRSWLTLEVFPDELHDRLSDRRAADLEKSLCSARSIQSVVTRTLGFCGKLLSHAERNDPVETAVADQDRACESSAIL